MSSAAVPGLSAREGRVGWSTFDQGRVDDLAL
jgi:hypothetical protein